MNRQHEPAGTARRWLAFLHELADQADRLALRHFRSQGLETREKTDLSPVTAADLEIERMVRESAQGRFPGLGLFGEEFGEAPSADGARLIVDPIDGTSNFARGIPIFATLLAIEQEGRLVAGLASAPALATRWSAARGAGAWRNGEAIGVSRIERLQDAQFLHGGLYGAEQNSHVAGFAALAAATKRERGFGDFYQHVLVAEGAAEIALDVGLKAWDAAALIVIVEEAGGRATTLDGVTDMAGGSLVTSNGVLHDAALTVLGGGGH